MLNERKANLRKFYDKNGNTLDLTAAKNAIKSKTLQQFLQTVFITPKATDSDIHALLTACDEYVKMKNRSEDRDIAIGKADSTNNDFEEAKKNWENEKKELEARIKGLETEIDDLKKNKKTTAKPEEIKAKEAEIKNLQKELKKAQKELEKLQKAQTGVPAGKPASKPTAAPAAPEADDVYVRYITQANQTRLAGAYFDEQGKPWKLADVQTLQEHCPTIWNQVAKWQPCAIDDNGNIVAQKAVSQSPDDVFKSMGMLQ